VVESQLGQVDATLDSRMEEIRRSLLAHLEES
jgi:flagellar biosynthesis/type III secretory pathway protein FliH